MSDVDYADDLALLTNRAVQAKSLLHSLEQAVRVIGFHVSAIKTVICLKQKKPSLL